MKTNEKHTPGPWQAIKNRTRGYVVDRDHADYHLRLRVAKVHVGELKTDEEIEANARLIAASPELLTALEALVAYQESTDLDDEPEDGEYGDGKRALLAARAALAKARGGPSP